MKRLTLLQRLKRIFLSWDGPQRLSDEISIIGRDRDNWLMSCRGRTAAVYTPDASLWRADRVYFEGVVQNKWDSPDQTQIISDEDKEKIEQALRAYLTGVGVRCCEVNGEVVQVNARG